LTTTFRKIKKEDNAPLAEMIRRVFREFKIDKPGTVYTDPSTDTLFELFQAPGSIYWIAEEQGRIIGGCGIFPTEGLPIGCAELVKFYLAQDARGKGIGRELMQKSITSAKEKGYTSIYLESFPELSRAVSMYEKAGFKKLEQPLGNSGHFACNLWMKIDL
jgi:putative acetyltransferase